MSKAIAAGNAFLNAMNIFNFRDHLIDEYRSYVTSFIKISNPGISNFAESCFARGALWPEPLIQLNPTFKPGKTIEELIAEGLLHADCAKVFQRDKGSSGAGGIPLRLHAHQEAAIRKAGERRSYVLTTGTGSGKSLAYIVPIVDRVIREGKNKRVRPTQLTIWF